MSTPPDDPRSHGRTPPTQETLLAALHEIRSAANAGLLHVSQIASAGELGRQQNDHQRAALHAVQSILRVIEHTIGLPSHRPAARAANEHWNALEHSDPLDDRFQDAPVMLDDRQGRDDQMIS
ncbi:MAG: hypothetical protein IPM16_03820 [Chloroflexi bacterium]|nr:hypothetical protein [Chloroflexota bacterium]